MSRDLLLIWRGANSPLVFRIGYRFEPIYSFGIALANTTIDKSSWLAIKVKVCLMAIWNRFYIKK